MSKKMHILHVVEAYPPALGGMAEVVYQLSEGLAKKGHDVTVATGRLPREQTTVCPKGGNYARNDKEIATSTSSTRNDTTRDDGGVTVEEFKISGRSVHGINGELDEIVRFRNLLRNKKFDVVVIFAAQIWTADIAFDIFHEIKAKIVWVPTGLSGLNLRNFSNYYHDLSKLVKHFDLGIFLSDQYQDFHFCYKSGLKNMVVITNGASKKEFENDPIQDEKHTLYELMPDTKGRELIVHVGSHTGLKGHRELMWIYAKAKLRKVSTLVLIGNKSPKGCFSSCWWRIHLLNLYFAFTGADKKIVMTDKLSRAQTVTVLKKAKLFLFPSNIECSPIVLFEAMASKTPFLATPAGNSEQIAQWFEQENVILPVKKKKTLVFADVDKSAKMLSEIMNDDRRLEKQAEVGHAIWQKKYTWEKIVDNYEDEYLKLLS